MIEDQTSTISSNRWIWWLVGGGCALLLCMAIVVVAIILYITPVTTG